MKKLILLLLAFSLILISCNQTTRDKAKTPPSVAQKVASQTPVSTLTLDIIPYDDMPLGMTAYVYSRLLEIYPRIILHKPIKLPKSAYYSARSRYRADTLIRLLASVTPKDHVTLAITTRDISCTKGQYTDFGIMGLSYCPGKACVASTFRLDKGKIKDQFFKIAIHELGHTQGIDHCPEKTCFMRDAEGKNHTDEVKEFCKKCKSKLIERGWQL
jgi:archaemetzincin